ncbi:proline--tRNA ligase [Erysipelotrichaceae bacterium]|nr:proline--tRNA ligase [Erysipelotrichaceae bacterium]
MKQATYFIPTAKDAPKDAQIASHRILLQGGYVKQTAAGIYSYLPLGQRVMQKIEAIVRTELNAIDAHEIFMPVLQPVELWNESGRFSEYGPELMTMKDRHDRTFILGPTHEEVITDIVRDHIKSYKKMPLSLYQIQTKFRDELRPRFGLMRGREFTMMDAYSFTAKDEDTNKIYDNMGSAYAHILDQLKLEYRMVSAISGQIGGSESAEFMVLSQIGEDTVLYSDTSDFASNLEVYPELKAGDKSPDGHGILKEAKGIEVGHIFKLGTKYSVDMKANFTNNKGELEPIIMGCYGLGISRLIMALLEQNQVEGKVVWPLAVAPFKVHILLANIKNTEQVAAANTVYAHLQEAGVDVLFDNRDERLGAKFGDADLIGSPIRVVVGKGVENGVLECLNFLTDKKVEIAIENVVQTIKDWL